jgi:hypothetical protein
MQLTTILGVCCIGYGIAGFLAYTPSVEALPPAEQDFIYMFTRPLTAIYQQTAKGTDLATWNTMIMLTGVGWSFFFIVLGLILLFRIPIPLIKKLWK